MNKDKLRMYYNSLNDCYKEYMSIYGKKINKSDETKKGKTSEDAKIIIARVKKIIEDDQLLLNLAMQPENFTNGVISVDYFYEDMPKFLKRIHDSLEAYN